LWDVCIVFVVSSNDVKWQEMRWMKPVSSIWINLAIPIFILCRYAFDSYVLILSTSLWVLFCNQQHKTYIQYSHQFCSVGQINFMYNRSIKETTITNKIYGKYIVEHVCDLLLGPHEIWVTKEQDTKQFSTIIEWINNAMSNLI
jgi:hypothetical protein